MIRKKRYLAAKMGLLALGLMLMFPGQAEAADKKTIYNSPYVSFSPDGKAFTSSMPLQSNALAYCVVLPISIPITKVDSFT